MKEEIAEGKKGEEVEVIEESRSIDKNLNAEPMTVNKTEEAINSTFSTYSDGVEELLTAKTISTATTADEDATMIIAAQLKVEEAGEFHCISLNPNPNRNPNPNHN